VPVVSENLFGTEALISTGLNTIFGSYFKCISIFSISPLQDDGQFTKINGILWLGFKIG